jgi:hypothetical protein
LAATCNIGDRPRNAWDFACDAKNRELMDLFQLNGLTGVAPRPKGHGKGAKGAKGGWGAKGGGWAAGGGKGKWY